MPSVPSTEHLRVAGREQDDFLDRVDAGEQHRHTIHADAEAAGRRHAVLERAEVVLVDRSRLGVAGILGRLLVLEPRPLLDGIVELASSRWPVLATSTNSSKRSVRHGSSRSTRASGEISIGWPVTNVGRTMSASHSGLEQLLDELAAAPRGPPSGCRARRRACGVRRSADSGGPCGRSSRDTASIMRARGHGSARSTSCVADRDHGGADRIVAPPG